MSYMFTTWMALGVAFIASGGISMELAKRENRDEYVYFFLGLFLGPIAILLVLTPLPGEGQRGRRMNRPLRVIQGPRCPGCGKNAPPRTHRCPYCGEPLQAPWWDREIAFR